jgi:hypothetical protein
MAILRTGYQGVKTRPVWMKFPEPTAVIDPMAVIVAVATVADVNVMAET